MSWPGLCSWCGRDTRDCTWMCLRCAEMLEGIENGTHCHHGNEIPFVKDKRGNINTDIPCVECEKERKSSHAA